MEGARRRLVSCTIALLRSRGVQATGIAEIVQQSGAARRSIYNHFPSGKMELMVEATRVAGAHVNGAIRHLTEDSDPQDSLTGFVEFWKQAMIAEDFQSGCPIAMAALGSFDTPALARQAADVFSEWRDTLAAQLQAHGLTAAEAASLATFTLSAVEGAIVQAIAYRSTDPLDVTHEHMAALLRQRLSPNTSRRKRATAR